MDDERLQALYPQLGVRVMAAADESRASLAASARAKAAASCTLKTAFFEQHADALVDAARAIASIYAGGGRMFSMGNGGSSCDAAHFAVEFSHPVTVGRPALTAINLVDDHAMLTAVGNDVGFDQVFVRRLLALARAGDGLVGFSTSGNSANLAAAFRKARELGVHRFALLGGDGGEIRASGLADHCLCVESDSIHRVQEVHVAIYHVLWDLVHTLLADVPVQDGTQR